MTTTSVCPICKRAVAARPENAAFPFCTPRCRAIDLGKWLGEEYRFAVRSVDEDDDGDVMPPPAMEPKAPE